MKDLLRCASGLCPVDRFDWALSELRARPQKSLIFTVTETVIPDRANTNGGGLELGSGI